MVTGRMWEYSAGKWMSAPATKDESGAITIIGGWREESFFGGICADFFRPD